MMPSPFTCLPSPTSLCARSDCLSTPVHTVERESARSWALDSLTDTVRLTFSRGLHGYVFALHGPGDTLTGHLSEWSDVPPFTREHGPAAAHRVRCDSAAPPAT